MLHAAGLSGSCIRRQDSARSLAAFAAAAAAAAAAMSSDLGSGELGDGGMSLLSIFATWGVPFALSLAAATYSLSRMGWSPMRLDGLLATSSMSNLQYARAAPAAVLLYRLLCLLPLVFLVMLGTDLVRQEPNRTSLGVCVLLVGPSLLLLGWAGLRAASCRWHVPKPLLAAAIVGGVGLLAAQLALAFVASTTFFSFSWIFLGLNSVPIALVAEIGFDANAPPLLSLRAAMHGRAANQNQDSLRQSLPTSQPIADASATGLSGKASAVHSPDGHLARADERPVLQLENSGVGRCLRRRLLIVAGASYLVIIIAYAGAGVASRDVAQYAAAATAACVVVFDGLAFALRLQGAVSSAPTLLLLCVAQRAILCFYGASYIDEGEAHAAPATTPTPVPGIPLHVTPPVGTPPPGIPSVSPGGRLLRQRLLRRAPPCAGAVVLRATQCPRQVPRRGGTSRHGARAAGWCSPA